VFNVFFTFFLKSKKCDYMVIQRAITVLTFQYMDQIIRWLQNKVVIWLPVNQLPVKLPVTGFNFQLPVTDVPTFFFT